MTSTEKREVRSRNGRTITVPRSPRNFRSPQHEQQKSIGSPP